MRVALGKRNYVVIAVAVLIAFGGIYFLWASGERNVIPIGGQKAFVVGGSPHAIVAVADAVWLTDVERRSVLKIDPATGRIELRVRLNFSPGDIAVTAGTVWVGAIEGRAIARLDADSGDILDTIPVGRTPQSLTVADDRVWVAAFDDGSIQALGVTSGRREGEPLRTKDSFPSALAWGFDSLWVADVVDDVVERIQDSDTEVREIPVGDSPTAIVAGEGAVWTANFNERTVSRIDPETNRAGDPILVGGKPGGIAAGAGYVWVTRPSADALVGIEVASGSWTGEIIEVGAQPQGVAVFDSVVWVANQGDGTISRIEVETEG